jgi:shikimate kinase
VLPGTNRNIALTGFMAVGKSAVGRTLAKKLKRRFLDLDKVVEKAEGMKVREIFAQKGQPYFRQREKEALVQVLQHGGQVIATGGGVIMDEDNLRLLRERAFLVCLTASTEALLKRAGNGTKRPLLRRADRKERIAELLSEREAKYAQADAMIDTTHLSIDQVVEKVVELINSATPEKWQR